MVALLKIKFYENGALAVLTYADGTLFFVFLLFYAFSMVTLSFLISTLFSTGEYKILVMPMNMNPNFGMSCLNFLHD